MQGLIVSSSGRVYAWLMRNNGKQQLQLASVQVGQEPDVHALVLLFKQTGGNLNSFFKRLPGVQDKQSFLSRLVEELEQPKNSELKQDWDKTLFRGDHVRRLLIRDKAWVLAEQWRNLSETNSAPDIAFIKCWLPEIKVMNQEESQEIEMDEQQAKEDAEINKAWCEMQLDGNNQCQQQYSPPPSPARSQ